jgi:hypothetical protein
MLTDKPPRRDELKPKAESISRTHNRRHARMDGRIEFNLQQVARIEQDARVQHHSALAQFSAASLHHCRRKAFGRNHPHGQVNGQTVPAARASGSSHGLAMIL